MRDELQKLIKELRNDAERIAADHTRTNVCDQLTGAICHWCATKRLLINTEARLQSILDADDAQPVPDRRRCGACNGTGQSGPINCCQTCNGRGFFEVEARDE